MKTFDVSVVESTDIKTIALVELISPISIVNLSITLLSTKFFTLLRTADSDNFNFFPISTNDSLESFLKYSTILSSILFLEHFFFSPR